MSVWSRIAESNAKFLFFPITLFYWGIVFWRNVFYNFGFFITRKAPSRIISVGNITAGGTGKTPAVIYLAELLKKNHKIVVVSRGYGRKTSGTQLVTDGSIPPNDWRNYGDEPTQIGLKLNGVPVVVDSNRYRGALYAIKKFNSDIIILDDAFQHRALERDLDLVLLNSQAPSKSYKLIPNGLLREPLNHIKRGDAIILTKSNLANIPPKILESIKKTGLPIFQSTLENVGFVSKDLKPFSLDGDESAVVVSAIADPNSLYKSLKLANIKVASKLIYHDHYEFTDSDINTMKRALKDHNASIVITTEKDMVRLRDLNIDGIKICALRIKFELDKNGESYILDKIS